jgi:hypothetical protein
LQSEETDLPVFGRGGKFFRSMKCFPIAPRLIASAILYCSARLFSFGLGASFGDFQYLIDADILQNVHAVA